MVAWSIDRHQAEKERQDVALPPPCPFPRAREDRRGCERQRHRLRSPTSPAGNVPRPGHRDESAYTARKAGRLELSRARAPLHPAARKRKAMARRCLAQVPTAEQCSGCPRARWRRLRFLARVRAVMLRSSLARRSTGSNRTSAIPCSATFRVARPQVAGRLPGRLRSLRAALQWMRSSCPSPA